MKKILSVILAFVMMLSLASVSFAADNSLILGKTYTITVTGDDDIELEYTPLISGLYKAEITFANTENTHIAFAECLIFHDGNFVNSTFISYLSDKNNNLNDVENEIGLLKTSDFAYFVGEKGDTMDLSLSKHIFNELNDSVDKSIEINITISMANAPIKTIGSTFTTDKGNDVFILAPLTDTVYNFKSETQNLCIDVNNVDGSLDQNCFYDEATNFTINLDGGKIYAVAISGDIVEEGISSYSIAINDGSNIKPEQIYSEPNVYVVKDSICWVWVSFYPYGTDCNAKDFIATVADENIAYAEVDTSDNSVCITGLKKGDTTVTITEPSTGISTEIRVHVASAFEDFILNIPTMIYAFFMNVVDFILGLFS